MTLGTVHDDLVMVARDFTAHVLVPRSQALDAMRPGVAAAVWRQVAELGLDRALLAEARGGVGLDVGDFLCVLEEVAVGDAGVALEVLLNNTALVSLPAELVADLPEGTRWTVGFAPGPGESPVAGVDLIRDGGSVFLTGRLAAVFGAVGADGTIVTTRQPKPAVIAVSAAAPGLTISAYPLQLGLRAAAAADLIFARVAGAEVPGEGAAVVESRARALVRCGVAAIANGIARRAHEIARDYAHTRIQGGVRLVRHGAIKDMLAGMVVRLHAAAACRLGAAADDPGAALAHKVAASDAAAATTIDAVQLLGGMGYMVDTGVEKLMRDAKYCQLYPERNWLAGAELIDPEGSSSPHRPW